MAQAGPQVIIPRRNFLIRALGFTAAGATLTLPIVTMDDARVRACHHAKGLLRALQDLYPATRLSMCEWFPDIESASDQEFMRHGPLLAIRAEPATEPHDPRPVISDWRKLPVRG